MADPASAGCHYCGCVLVAEGTVAVPAPPPRHLL